MKTCSVCLDNIESNAFKTNCGHYFHNQCLLNWLLTNHTCPVCRNDLAGGEVTTYHLDDDEEREKVYNIYLDGDEHFEEDIRRETYYRILDYIYYLENDETHYYWTCNLDSAETTVKMKKYIVNMIVYDIEIPTGSRGHGIVQIFVTTKIREKKKKLNNFISIYVIFIYHTHQICSCCHRS